MCTFYVQTKQKALLLMPLWQRTDSWDRLYYVFLVPNDTINHFGLWEHCVLQVPMLLARAPPRCYWPSLLHSPFPSWQTANTSLAVPFHAVASVVGACVFSSGLLLCIWMQNWLCVSTNVSPETHPASLFAPGFYLHCKWTRNVSGFVSFLFDLVYTSVCSPG